MLTDSGGFQVFSLQSKVTEGGVWFTSHLDGSRHFMTPEKSIKIQKAMGADIIMAFDECARDCAAKTYLKEAMVRTHQWLVRSKKEWGGQKQSALFGIIQGGFYKDLRRQSAEFVVGQNLPGIALGGQAIGFDLEKTSQILDWIKDLLPSDKPIYTMGVGGKPQDLEKVVNLGVDIFDCVAPTRQARNGTLYVNGGVLNIANSRFKKDNKPIDARCDCLACRTPYSRSYLRHLYKARELLYYRLSSIHNIRFMVKICQKLREDILCLPED